MDYAITRSDVSPQLIAAVRARVARNGVAQAYRTSLDQVWAFLRLHPGLRTDGHNLFLYHHADLVGPETRGRDSIEPDAFDARTSSESTNGPCPTATYTRSLK